MKHPVLLPLSLSLLAVACVTPPVTESAVGAGTASRTTTVPPEPSTVHSLASRARYHVLSAVELSDSAAVQAQIATTEDEVADAQSLLALAAEATRVAGGDLRLAIEAGDRLEFVVGDEERKTGRRGFAHYWELGRAKLDTARSRQELALVAADSAMACSAAACTSARATEMRNQLLSASGATREAESLVRIALLYIKGL